ncbi:MAG: hypothetical protein DRH08_02660 [Deltaproteobacteria bacterium]|nr:MAG: hypothetical protein DRH08_02660 [Deltaproteobacteria bacterium]
MKAHDRENGRIIIMVLIVVFTLSAFWFIALSVTGSELQIVGGRKSAAQQFFDAEAGLNAAIENFDTLYNTLLLESDLTIAVATLSPTDPTTANRVVAEVTCRPIQDEDATLAASYNLPVQAHEFSCPPGSGGGVNTTICRRYGITAVANGKEIQIGVFRPFTSE